MYTRQPSCGLKTLCEKTTLSLHRGVAVLPARTRKDTYRSCGTGRRDRRYHRPCVEFHIGPRILPSRAGGTGVDALRVAGDQSGDAGREYVRWPVTAGGFVHNDRRRWLDTHPRVDPCSRQDCNGE